MAISRWITLTMTNVSNKRYRENQNTRFMFINIFRKTRAVYMVKPVMAQITIWRIRVACWINKISRTKAYARAPTSTPTRTHARMHTHTEICNTYCYYMATMVSGTRLIVALYVHCLYCWKWILPFKACSYISNTCTNFLFIIHFYWPTCFDPFRVIIRAFTNTRLYRFRSQI